MRPEEMWSRALHVWRTGAQELERLERNIGRESFQRCVQVLANCRGRILTSGAGTSAMAAKKVSHSLCCVERPSFFISPSDAVHGGLGAAREGDVAILFSKGGGTEEVVNLIPSLKKKGVFIIGVTENESSVLARNSDLLIKLKIEREADEFNMLATTSTTVVLSLFDAVCIVLMQHTGFTKEQFAVIHPRGAVGERLKKETKKEQS